MSDDRVTALLDTYGADARRWPEGERAAFARAPSDAVRDAAALDRALDAYETPFDSEAFTARALGVFPPGAEVVQLAPRRRLAPILALAACAAFGALLGVGAGLSAPTDAADETIASAFGYDLSASDVEEATDG